MTPVQYYYINGNLMMPWDNLYPECRTLREGHPNTYVMQCLRQGCTQDRRCMEILAKRVYYWFDKLEPRSKSLEAYFKAGPKLGVVAFLNSGVGGKIDLEEPKMILPSNPSGFEVLRKKAVVKTAVLPDEYWRIDGVYSSPAIIPAENLLVKR